MRSFSAAATQTLEGPYVREAEGERERCVHEHGIRPTSRHFPRRVRSIDRLLFAFRSAMGAYKVRGRTKEGRTRGRTDG